MAELILKIAYSSAITLAAIVKTRSARRLACAASDSARVRRESWEESKKRNDGEGGGERRNRLPANPTIFKNYVRPRTQLLIGVVLVVLIA